MIGPGASVYNSSCCSASLRLALTSSVVMTAATQVPQIMRWNNMEKFFIRCDLPPPHHIKDLIMD